MHVRCHSAHATATSQMPGVATGGILCAYPFSSLACTSGATAHLPPDTKPGNPWWPWPETRSGECGDEEGLSSSSDTCSFLPLLIPPSPAAASSAQHKEVACRATTPIWIICPRPRLADRRVAIWRADGDARGRSGGEFRRYPKRLCRRSQEVLRGLSPPSHSSSPYSHRQRRSAFLATNYEMERLFLAQL